MGKKWAFCLSSSWLCRFYKQKIRERERERNNSRKMGGVTGDYFSYTFMAFLMKTRKTAEVRCT